MLIIIGLFFLTFALLAPLPTILTIPGVMWRIILGIFSCALIAIGICKTTLKR